MAKKSTEVAVPKPALGKRIKANWQLYLLLLIPFVLTFIYKYIPMYGIQIAFRDYKASRGMFGSEWVGLKWFERFFTAPTAGRMIRNTFLCSVQPAVELPDSDHFVALHQSAEICEV